jgi:hypothetical protein
MRAVSESRSPPVPVTAGVDSLAAWQVGTMTPSLSPGPRLSGRLRQCCFNLNCRPERANWNHGPGLPSRVVELTDLVKYRKTNSFLILLQMAAKVKFSYCVSAKVASKCMCVMSVQVKAFIQEIFNLVDKDGSGSLVSY